MALALGAAASVRRGRSKLVQDSNSDRPYTLTPMAPSSVGRQRMASSFRFRCEFVLVRALLIGGRNCRLRRGGRGCFLQLLVALNFRLRALRLVQAMGNPSQ